MASRRPAPARRLGGMSRQAYTWMTIPTTLRPRRRLVSSSAGILAGPRARSRPQFRRRAVWMAVTVPRVPLRTFGATRPRRPPSGGVRQTTLSPIANACPPISSSGPCRVASARSSARARCFGTQSVRGGSMRASTTLSLCLIAKILLGRRRTSRRREYLSARGVAAAMSRSPPSTRAHASPTRS